MQIRCRACANAHKMATGMCTSIWETPILLDLNTFDDGNMPNIENINEDYAEINEEVYNITIYIFHHLYSNPGMCG